MSAQSGVSVFGEVLFDCFETGETVLGGAPFNVAWHLNFLGDNPRFISRVGKDEMGNNIVRAMELHGMDTAWVQRDAEHETGQVRVTVDNGDPQYSIKTDSAYDYIEADGLPALKREQILYHGTLGLRHEVSRRAFGKLAASGSSIFLDVNLRSPWWELEHVLTLVKQARWCKLNQDELELLAGKTGDPARSMQDFLEQYELEQVILTRGGDGVMVYTAAGELYHERPALLKEIVDAVGAGDAFSAVYIHGILSGWPVFDSIVIAQAFAGRILGHRGATPSDPAFYDNVALN